MTFYYLSQMRRAVFKAALLATVAGVFVAAAPGHAQESAAAAEAEPLDEGDIIVTAQRREQKLSDVPLAISAIGGEALVNRNFTGVDELGKLVPSLTVADSGYASPIYTLRGVGVNDPSIGSSPSVSVYLDQVPLAYPILAQGVTFDLERVEVLKGPQGTLYGQNATGGAINYIAKHPTDRFQAGVGATFGRFSRGNVEGYVSGPVTDTLRARIAGRASFGDGWQRSMSRPGDKLGRIENYTGRMIVDFEPSDRARFSLNVNGWLDKSDTLAPQFLSFTTPPQNVANAPTPTPPYVSPGNSTRLADWDAGVDLARDDKFWQASLRGDFDLTDQLSLTSISAYSKLKRFQRSDQDGSPYYVLRLQQQGSIDAKSQELRLTANFSEITWVAGGNVSDDKTSENLLQFLPQSIQVSSLGATGGRVDYDQRIKNWSLFTNIDIKLTDKLTIGGGIRRSQETRRFSGCSRIPDTQSGPGFTALINSFRTAAGLARIPTLQAGDCLSFYTSAATLAKDLNAANLTLFTPGLSNFRLKENNVPWSLNANYKVTGSSLLYARVSRGFKAGNFSSLNTLDAQVYSPITQEKLTAYEVGGRAAFGRLLSIEGAVFVYDYVDKQLRARIASGPPFGNINAQQNVPKSRVTGAEAAITLRPARGLSLATSATYLDTNIRQYTGQTVKAVTRDFRGASFNFTPKWSVNADVNYETSLTGTIDIFGGINYAYRSATSGVLVPVIVATPAAAVDDLSLFDIKAYSLVDAQLGIKAADRRWKAFVWGKNVFNQYYTTNKLRASTVNVAYPGQPATYGVTLSYDF